MSLNLWRRFLLTLSPDIAVSQAYQIARRAAPSVARQMARQMAQGMLAEWLKSAYRVGVLARVKPVTKAAVWPVRDEAASWLISHGLADLPAIRAVAREAEEAASAELLSRAETAAAEFARALADDVRRGGTLPEFRAAVADAADAAKLSPRALEHVYRDGVGRAQAAGRAHVMGDPRVSSHFPYRAWFAVHDGRTQSEHREMERAGLDGTNVYRADDPLFDKFTPPVRPNCRCDVVPYTVRMAAEEGVEEARRWLQTGIKPDGRRWLLPPYPLPDVKGWTPTPSAKGPF